MSRYTKKSLEQAEKQKPFDVIVVPGVPYDGDKTTTVMKMRLHWAKYLYDNGFCRNIIFSGSAVYTPYTEGVIMKIMADSLGIPTDRTFSETKAEHSTENIYYSWKMAKSMGFEKIALASDPYQSRLLRRFQKKYCPGTKSIPIVLGTMNIEEKKLPVIDPSTARVSNFKSIKERESFFQRLRYTLGRRVKQEVREARKSRKDKNA
ncbi:YdcF family protein [Pseudochryseolinea flava]|nr:YdcF family protein [Pseudochryseolinea flava]